jgi:hypothetical protein
MFEWVNVTSTTLYYRIPKAENYKLKQNKPWFHEECSIILDEKNAMLAEFKPSKWR